MTSELQFLLITALVTMFFIFMISTKQPKPEPKSKSKSKSHHDEVIDTLDWMLKNHIITQQEYTKLIGKCLQYL